MFYPQTMPRIRSIKPDFWADDKLGPLDPLTRLVFLGLISLADDAGRLIDAAKLLDGQLFPFTDDTCSVALERLAELGVVVRYASPSGQRLIQIVNWSRHQKIDRPNRQTLPGPAAQDEAHNHDTISRRTIDEDSTSTRRSVDEPSSGDGMGWDGDGMGRDAQRARSREDDVENRVDKRAPLSIHDAERTPTDMPPLEQSAAMQALVRGPPVASGIAKFLAAMPPERRHAWTARLTGWLAGMGVPPGQTPTRELLDVALSEYAETPTANYGASHVWSFYANVARRFASPGPSQQVVRGQVLDQGYWVQQYQALVDARRMRTDGEAWWARMLQEAAAAGVHPVIYAHSRRDEPADGGQAAA